MPDESTFDCSRIQQPEDLDGLSKEELVAFLRSDCEGKVELWHIWQSDHWLIAYRRETPPLDNVDFSNIELRKINFLETNLRGSQFRNTHLQFSILAGAQLQGANFYRAQLQHAFLSGARLDGAILVEAHLDFAILGRTDFRDVSLSSVASMHGVHLYQTRFWGVLDLRYEQFLNDSGQSTIWEHTHGRFSEAKDVYKTLKGYFEDAGDYEGANWAYVNEQRHEKWMRCPPKLGYIIYRRWRKQYDDAEHVKQFCDPKLLDWLRLEFAEKIANYGDSLLRPLFWMAFTILFFALIYLAFGLATNDPTCAYGHLGARPYLCTPTRNFANNLLFSISAITTVDVSWLQPSYWWVSYITSLEMLIGIALTGLFGFVLGNKLRFS